MIKTMLRAMSVCALGAGALATPAAADIQIELYTQQLDAPYSQSWWGIIKMRDTIGAGVVVVGEGKLGDFAAWYFIDCVQPEKSRWDEVLTGFIKTSSVPPEVIQEMRRQVCP